MELNGKLMKVDVEADLEGMVGKETTNIGNASCGSELDYCPKCFELEEKCKKAEKRCTVLELEIERNKFEFESLKSKLSTVNLDKPVVEDEVCRLEKENRALQNKFTDFQNHKMATSVEVKGSQDDNSIDKGDKIFELMVENNALNAEVGVLEARCKDLELQVAELQKSLNSKVEECTLTGTVKVGPVSSGGGEEISEVKEMQCGFYGAATPVIDTLFSNVVHEVGAKSDILHGNEVGYVSRAQKQLVFEEGTSARKMTPITPARARPPPLCPIDISDSDDDDDDEANTINLPILDIQAGKRACGSSDADNVFSTDTKELTSQNNLTWSPIESEEDDVPHCNRRASSMSNAKRKSASNVIASDSGSDTDDNFPICRLRKDHLPESTLSSLQNSNYTTVVSSGNKDGKPIPRRQLVPLRKQFKEGTSERCSHSDMHSNETRPLRGIPTNGTFKVNETEEDESDSEDESLNGFIVGSSDSEGDSASKVNVISTSDERSSTAVSDDASDSNVDYGDIISRIGRRKDRLIKWVVEADMLAAFGKDPELCMKAVCALYRRQTSEERLSKATIFANQRGFSQCDAVRGSKLGEFLTGGDPMGDLKKSAKELQEHDPKGGVEMCRKLATHYSKQLFAMYKNKEDPLWPALEPN